MLNASVNFGIIFSLFIAFLLVTGNFPGWIFFAIIPVLLIQVLFAIGLGVTLGVLNVFFRDVGQLVGVVLQFWFWFTPIVYPLNILPAWLQSLMKLNPMATLIGSYQGVMVHGLMPDWIALLPIALLSLFICFLGLRLFKKHSGELVDEL